MIVDAWVQHPTLRHARDPVLDSLRRWNREEAPTQEFLWRRRFARWMQPASRSR